MSGGRSVDVARQLLETLLAHGSEEIVLSPGSRSGPLALAAHAADAQGRLRLHVRVDEREAGFLGLGLAAASGRPVAVVTTSGTAVANLHPAMLEALHAGVRLVAVTADRPARLRGTGANQTTDQRGIFPGVPFVGSLEELAVPQDGPLHLNLELDEPLVEAVDWTFSPAPPPPGSPVPAGPPVRLTGDARTVVVAGDSRHHGAAARATAEAGGWPLLAEPSSNARAGDLVVDAYRQVLAHLPDAAAIERVVSFGHPTLSRPLARLLARDDLDVVHVGTQSTFPVPAGPRVTFAGHVEVAQDGDPAWAARWVDAGRRAAAAIDGVLAPAGPHRVAAAVWAAVGADDLLVLGSSNPVRDIDLLAPAATHRVLANRGLAGIDGMLSTALGATLAHQRAGTHGGAGWALVGDLTFLHGANGLLIGPREPRPDLTIVVVSDDGGSIFSTLEQGGPEHAAAFERVFGTPTGARIDRLCAAHGVPHRRVLATDLPEAMRTRPDGVRVVEVPVRRDDRRAVEAEISAAARAALA